MFSGHRTSSESGQALVLLALAFVILLASAGLAIDGGMMYTERRRAQNAADAASMAGAYAMLNSGNPVVLAYARALDNGYNNDQVENWVEVYWPPIHGPTTGDWNHIEVVIRARVDAVFSHLVFPGPLENTVTAIARARPPTAEPLVDGQALVGLAPHGCSVVWSHGTNLSLIEGSGIFVNSDDPDCAMVANGGNELNVADGNIYVVGGWEIGNNTTVTPLPIAGVDQVSMPEVEPPTCSGSATVDPVLGTMTPGNITNIEINNGNWTLAPGIYCIEDDLRFNGGSITAEDVMFYVQTGTISWSGNATLHLDAPDDGPWAGMLVYQNANDTNRATLNGGSNSYIQGTIFIPGAEVQINGTGGANGLHSQVVAYKVDLSGTADLHIVYVPEEQFLLREPGKVELTE
ncbi:MAG TPA: Tad domain-containing protein [Anaerolineales bacterium]|nr:Tad domain-containing protein [Anaerolineales bacterium]